MSHYYTIINRHPSGMQELIPTNRATAKRLINERALDVKTTSRTYRDRCFILEPGRELIEKSLRVRPDQLEY